MPFKRNRYLISQVVFAVLFLIIVYIQYALLHNEEVIATLIKIGGLIVQVFIALLIRIFYKANKSSQYAKEKNPWRKTEWQHFGNIFEIQYNNVRSAGPKWRLSFSTFGRILYGLFYLVLFVTFLAIFSININYESQPFMLFRGYTLTHIDEFICCVILLFILTVIIWRIKEVQHRNKNERNKIVMRTIENIQMSGFPYRRHGAIEDEKSASKLVREIMEDAIRVTEIGLHKKICRKVVSRLGYDLGPKSAWLFIPNRDDLVITELVTTTGRRDYWGACGNYHPKKLLIDKWKEYFGQLNQQLINPEQADPKQDNTRMEYDHALQQEKELSLKNQMYIDRWRYGSDVGFLYHFKASEITWFLGARCNMHDNRYLEHLNVARPDLYLLRSAMITPIYDGRDDEAEPLGMIGIYSPAAGEVDQVDFAYLTLYANILSVLLRFIKTNFGAYPMPPKKGEAAP